MMYKVTVEECPERPIISYKEGNVVYYTKITKAEKEYLKACRELMKKIDRQLKGE